MDKITSLFTGHIVLDILIGIFLINVAIWLLYIAWKLIKSFYIVIEGSVNMLSKNKYYVYSIKNDVSTFEGNVRARNMKGAIKEYVQSEVKGELLTEEILDETCTNFKVTEGGIEREFVVVANASFEER